MGQKVQVFYFAETRRATMKKSRFSIIYKVDDNIYIVGGDCLTIKILDKKKNSGIHKRDKRVQ